MGAVQLLKAGDGPGEAGPLLQGRSHGGSCSCPQGSHDLGHGAQSVIPCLRGQGFSCSLKMGQ